MDRTGDELPHPYKVLGPAAGASLKLGLRTRQLENYFSSSDVVLAHFAQDGWRASGASSKTGTPLFVYCHGSDVLTDFNYLRERGPSFSALVRNWQNLIERTTAFIAVSEFVACRLRALGVPASKVLVNYVGVRVNSSRELDTKLSEPRRLLFIGRLVENKGIAPLLESFQNIVCPKVPSAELHIVGDGPLRNFVQRAAAANPKVHYLGKMTSGQIDRLLGCQWIVVAPSQQAADGSSEGLNQVVLEAQSRGLPTLGTRTGGLPEALHSEKTIIEPDSTEAIGEACATALMDDKLWSPANVDERIAFVREKFELRSQTLKLMRVLEEAR